MAVSGEIASMYVRLRPSLTGFAGEAAAGVKASLAETQAAVASAARANISSATGEIDANRMLATSYRETAGAARENAAASGTVATHLGGVGRQARATEQELGRVTRGALAGSGVFRSLGRSLAFASGGFLAFAGVSKIVRDSLSSAADLQKAGETIRANFGAASAALTSFAGRAAAELGISRDTAEAAGAKFAILFRNIGIGRREGVGMTVGLEKLAGALGAIRHVNPADILAELPTALTGNARSLRSLGIVIDQTQIKYAALKLGLISNVKDAITPAIRAQATYALAIANLPAYLEQARRHSKDLADVQARLSAEFSNAKERLGEALLPTFTKYATQLANWIERMQRTGRLQRDFSAAIHTSVGVIHAVADAVKVASGVFHRLSAAVGGTKNLVVDLMAAWAVSKILPVANAFRTNLVTAVRAGQTAFRAAKAESVGAFATMRAGAIATGVTIRAALVETGIGLLVVAIGFAAGYVITHWDKVRRYTVALGGAIVGVWTGLKEAVPAIGATIGDSLVASFSKVFYVIAKGAADAFGWVPFLGGKLKDAAKAVGEFHDQATGALNSSTAAVRKGLSDVTKLSAQNWIDALTSKVGGPDAKAAAKKAGQDFGKAIADGTGSTAGAGAKSVTDAVNKAMASAIAAAHQRIENAVMAAKNNLDKIGGQLAATIDKILEKLGGTGGALAGSPQGQAFKKLRDLVASGAPSFEIARADKTLSTQLQNVGKTTAQDLKQKLADLTDQFNQGGLGVKQFNAKVNAILHANGANYKSAGKTGGRAFADAFKAEVTGLREQAQAIAAIPAKYRGAGGGGGAADIKIIRPLEVIRRENDRIAKEASKERARIAKATEKSANILQGMKTTHVGPLPGYGKTPPGHASKRAKASAAAGVQP